jgi:hypothetical protein
MAIAFVEVAVAGSALNKSSLLRADNVRITEIPWCTP